MSQTVVDFSDDMSGAALLDDYLTPFQANVLSGYGGTSRPASAIGGTGWIDFTTNPWVLYKYDGTSDVALGTINTSTHVFTPSIPAESLVLSKLSLDIFNTLTSITAAADDNIVAIDQSDSGKTKKIPLSALGVGPIFSAYLGSNQTITSGVTTKMNIDTERFDTASCFDTSNYRFTPNVAGWYQVSGNSHCSGTAINGVYLAIYKNGAAVGWGSGGSFSATIVAAHTSRIVYLNGTTDYIELYAFMASTGTPTLTAASGAQCYFDAHLIRGG